MASESKMIALLEETHDLREQFVKPVYMSLLHANFMRPSPTRTSATPQQISSLSKSISDGQIRKLLMTPEWRGRLVASWYVGLTGRSDFIDEIAELFLKSEMTYAGQGYCVALALIGDEKCQIHLLNYLCEYLPLRGRFYDQTWALAALTHIEGAPPAKFLDPILWTDKGHKIDPLEEISEFQKLVQYLQGHRMMTQ